MLKFIIKNKFFILQLTLMFVIAFHPQVLASSTDFTMSTSSPFDSPVNTLKTLLVDNLPKVLILIAVVLGGISIAMGENQIMGKISKVFIGAIIACLGTSVVSYFVFSGSSGACF